MAFDASTLVKKNARVVVALVIFVVVLLMWPKGQKCGIPPQPPPSKLAFSIRSNVGMPTRFLEKASFSCSSLPDDGLGKNPLPANLPKQLYPENKMNLQPFFEPSLVAEWQKSRLDPSAEPKPTCNDFGACVCPGDKLFDGRKCIDSWGPDPYKALRDRWAKAPLNDGRADETFSSPAEFAKFWESNAMFTDAWTAVHAGAFRGKKVLDVGAGYARQSFVFALHGAYVTHLDVVPKVSFKLGLSFCFCFSAYLFASSSEFGTY
jgi:hypothetical protein